LKLRFERLLASRFAFRCVDTPLLCKRWTWKEKHII